MNPRAHYGADEVDLEKVQFTPELLACVPAWFVRRYQVLPIRNLPDKLLVAVADPSDLDCIDSLHNLVGRDLGLCVAEASQLDEFVRRLFGEKGDA